MTNEWIIHDVKRKYPITEHESKTEERQKISEILSIHENKVGRPLYIEEIRDDVDKEFRNASYFVVRRLEQYYKDAQTSTFLTKEDENSFRFILKSIREYFLARRIVNCINNFDFELLIEYAMDLKTPETFKFISKITEMEWHINKYVAEQIQKKSPENSANIENNIDRSENIYQTFDFLQKNHRHDKVIY